MKRKWIQRLTVLVVTLMATGVYSSNLNNVDAASYNPNREYAVAEFKNMANIRWKPTKNLVIYGWTYSKSDFYKGMPYTQDFNTTYSSFVNRGTYVYLNGMNDYYLSYRGNSDVGNDCSTAVAQAWQFKYASLKYNGDIDTSNYLDCAQKGYESAYHLKTVGGYKMGNQNTDGFCNNTNDMNQYYKKLQKGDCLLYYYYKGDKLCKHVVLVVSVSSSGVTIMDQIGRKSGDTNSSWRHSKTYTWAQLKSGNYVPIYCTDLK